MNIHVSILIDSRSSLSYIAPKVVEKYKLSKEKQKYAWVVQLETGMKRKLTKLVKDYRLSFNGMDTTLNINILPLGSYDILIGMVWLEYHKAIIDCLHKSFDCMEEEGKRHTVKGVYRPIST